MPLILPGNVASATASTGYNIDNSCRFNQATGAYLTRTLGTPTNADRFTLSMWIKRGTLTINSGEYPLCCAGADSSNGDLILFRSGGYLEWQMWHGGATAFYKTNRSFHDTAAWYHLVFTYDSGNATAGDRMKIYVNGTEETSFSTETDVAQNTNSYINSANAHGIGDDGGTDLVGGTKHFDGYMAEVVLCDGQAYAASDFGEFDSRSPTIWKPKDVSGLTFGDNGFYLDFKDSDNLGDDESGNSLDFTETNIDATDQATDTPTNNFAVLNPLIYMASEGVLSEGNCTFQHHKTGVASLPSTLGMSAGKWYMECKFTVAEGGNERALTGVSYEPVVDAANNHFVGRQSTSWAYKDYDGALVHDTGSDHTGEGYGTGYNVNDIISIALDLDNSKLYFALNGTWQDSGDPTSGATGTGAISITAPASTTTGFYHFVPGNYSAGWYATWACNFGGCPAFALSSAVADENGYGAFEYAPPSGYLALCTKNLGSDGG